MSDYAKTAALIIGKSDAEENEERGPSTDEMLHQCMQDFHRCAHAESPDYRGMASAWRSAHEIMKSSQEKEEEERG